MLDSTILVGFEFFPCVGLFLQSISCQMVPIHADHDAFVNFAVTAGIRFVIDHMAYLIGNPALSTSRCPRDANKYLLVVVEAHGSARILVIVLLALVEKLDTTVDESIDVDLLHYWNFAGLIVGDIVVVAVGAIELVFGHALCLRKEVRESFYLFVFNTQDWLCWLVENIGFMNSETSQGFGNTEMGFLTADAIRLEHDRTWSQSPFFDGTARS